MYDVHLLTTSGIQRTANFYSRTFLSQVGNLLLARFRPWMRLFHQIPCIDRIYYIRTENLRYELLIAIVISSESLLHFDEVNKIDKSITSGTFNQKVQVCV